jgi:hypothetical protein
MRVQKSIVYSRLQALRMGKHFPIELENLLMMDNAD